MAKIILIRRIIIEEPPKHEIEAAKKPINYSTKAQDECEMDGVERTWKLSGWAATLGD